MQLNCFVVQKMTGLSRAGNKLIKPQKRKHKPLNCVIKVSFCCIYFYQRDRLPEYTSCLNLEFTSSKDDANFNSFYTFELRKQFDRSCLYRMTLMRKVSYVHLGCLGDVETCVTESSVTSSAFPFVLVRKQPVLCDIASTLEI